MNVIILFINIQFITNTFHHTLNRFLTITTNNYCASTG